MSSLILILIVVAWGLVLVPLLLRRHEAAGEAHSVDRFATAMRVLSRRTGPAGDSRYVVVPPRAQRFPLVVANGAGAYLTPATVPARAGAPVRRRRVVAVLAGLALGTGVLAAGASPVLWAAQLGCDVLLGGYLWQVRRVVRAGTRRAVVPAQGARPAPAGYARALPPPPIAGAVPDNSVTIERQSDGSWRPVPVPLPTYLTAQVGPVVPAARQQPEQAAEAPRRLAVND